MRRRSMPRLSCGARWAAAVAAGGRTNKAGLQCFAAIPSKSTALLCVLCLVAPCTVALQNGPPAPLPQVYWVDADYLEVAAAAARCGAHFTALLYIEAWQEEQHGWLVPLDASRVPTATALLPGSGSAGSEGPSGAGGGGQGDGRAEEQAAALERVRRLLLDTYRRVHWAVAAENRLVLHNVLALMERLLVHPCPVIFLPDHFTIPVLLLCYRAAPSTSRMESTPWRAPTACCPRWGCTCQGEPVGLALYVIQPAQCGV